QSLRIYLIAERYGRDKAYEEYQKKIRKEQEKGLLAAGRDFWILLFLGKRAEAAECFRGGVARSKDIYRPLLVQTAEYVAGSMSEDEFLKQMDGGESAYGRAFVVGLVRLSDGDRDGARERFQRVLATNMNHHFTYQLCRCLHERLKDPTWPKWI